VTERIVKACPRCGQPLEIKANRETGEQFLACSAYRETGCKYAEPLPEAIVLRRAGQKELFDMEGPEQ
jgi:ssDNA-binding Zn-finger/Zn-ribbon topoisomerase 1